MRPLLASFVLGLSAVVAPAAIAQTPATPATSPPASKSEGGFDISAMDRSVDPCVDFYEFACGGWRKANPIPPDQTRWGRFNELAEHEPRQCCATSSRRRRTPARAHAQSRPGSATTTRRAWTRAASTKQGARPLAADARSRIDGDRFEEGPVPAARRARCGGAARALPLRRRPGPARLQTDHRERRTGRPRAARSRRLPQGRRQDRRRSARSTSSTSARMLRAAGRAPSRPRPTRRRCSGSRPPSRGASRPRRHARSQEPRQPHDPRRARAARPRLRVERPTSRPRARRRFTRLNLSSPAVLRRRQRRRRDDAARRTGRRTCGGTWCKAPRPTWAPRSWRRTSASTGNT